MKWEVISDPLMGVLVRDETGLIIAKVRDTYGNAVQNAPLIASAPDLQSRLDYEIKRREAAERVIRDELLNHSTYKEATENLINWHEIVNQQQKP